MAARQNTSLAAWGNWRVSWNLFATVSCLTFSFNCALCYVETGKCQMPKVFLRFPPFSLAAWHKINMWLQLMCHNANIIKSLERLFPPSCQQCAINLVANKVLSLKRKNTSRETRWKVCYERSKAKEGKGAWPAAAAACVMQMRWVQEEMRNGPASLSSECSTYTQTHAQTYIYVLPIVSVTVCSGIFVSVYLLCERALELIEMQPCALLNLKW